MGRIAGAALGLGARESAAVSDVSTDTIKRLERFEPLRRRSVDALRSALGSAGMNFFGTDDEGLGVRLRKVHGWC